MGTARKFSRILHQEIDIQAAWLPVTNSFGLGDYGVISDGVFVRMGNIDEYGVTFDRAAGRPAGIKFRSEGTRVRRFVAGVEAPVLPVSDLDAKLVIEFAAADSFYIDAPQLKVEEITDVQRVAEALRAVDGWHRKFRVVYSTFGGESCTILSSRTSNAKVELSGTASALQMLELGRAELGITVSAEDSVGLEVVGRAGVIGLRLFKLRGFGGGPRLLGDDGEEHEGDLVEFDQDADHEDDL